MLGTDEYANDGTQFYGVLQESVVERIELPSTLKRIEYGAFKKCEHLKSIVLPDRLEYVGKECFLGSALEFIRLPPAMKTINDRVFYECKNLRKVEFSEGLEKIDLFAFN